MRHVKLGGLLSPMEKMANVAASVAQSAREATTRQSGTISVPNADGTRSILGVQNGNGRSMATHVGDVTPPPVPTGIRAWSGDGSLHVLWAGSLAGEVPADFDHVTVLVDGREVAEMRSAGSVTVDGLEAGQTVAVTATAEDDACLADGTPAHNVSAASAAVSVTIRDAAAEVKAEADEHATQITAIQNDVADFKSTAIATYATKTEVDDATGAITKTLSADYLSKTDASTTYAEKAELTSAVDQLSSTLSTEYTKTADLADTDAVKDAKAAGTTAQSNLEAYETTVSQTYATQSALTQTQTSLTASISDSLTTAKTYTDSSISTEVTNRNAAIKAQADSITATVSSTYATQEGLAAVQTTAEDAWSRTLRVQISSSPADATGDTSALTATVWRGGQQLTEQEVAMMGLLAWYVDGSRVATGYTYTCAAGTAVECRLEA